MVTSTSAPPGEPDSQAEPPTSPSSSSWLATVFNVPNSITWARLLLSVVVFVLMGWRLYGAATAVFVLAAGTDWLDGYIARRYQLITVLGRILDPLVDKVIVCGTFIYLAAEEGSGVVPGMAVVLVGRELLVTALRSHLEQQGVDFSANLSGKVKMILQSVAAPVALLSLSWQGSDLPLWLAVLRDLLVWSAVVATVLSGLVYVVAAVRHAQGQASGQDKS